MTGWNALTTLQQFYWVLALVATLFFLASSLLSFLDLGGHDAPDALGHDGAGHGGLEHEALEFLSLRNLLAFALGFGWGGVLLAPALGALSLPLAALVGLGFAWVNRQLSRQLGRLEGSGNLRLEEAIGQEARVSIRVDAERQGLGKVVVRVRERELELLAATEDEAPLARGERVQVYGVEDHHLLVSRRDRLGLRDL